MALHASPHPAIHTHTCTHTFSSYLASVFLHPGFYPKHNAVETLMGGGGERLNLDVQSGKTSRRRESLFQALKEQQIARRGAFQAKEIG